MDSWIGYLDEVAIGWIGLALVTFAALMWMNIVAPFGRHTKTTWGPMINNTLGWILMELPSPTMLWVSFMFFHSEDTSAYSYLPMSLWTLHYFNRTLIFPLRLKNKKKKMPLVITSSAIFFNLVNGSLNGSFLALNNYYSSDLLMIVGLSLFVLGMFINMRSDNMLLALRKPGETGYKIPNGFLFDSVSSPNLFGEIIEWAGFFLVAPSYASLSFLAWTCANLVPRARDHHKWYHDKFDNYPKNRKVLIPRIW